MRATENPLESVDGSACRYDARGPVRAFLAHEPLRVVPVGTIEPVARRSALGRGSRGSTLAVA